MGEMSYTAWRKSTFSDQQNECVEVSFAANIALVRDSKYLRDPSNDPAAQPIIDMDTATWTALLAAVGRNEYPITVDAVTITRTADSGSAIQSGSVVLRYTPSEWTAFVAGVAANEFAPAREAIPA
jgi:hypothetical protein